MTHELAAARPHARMASILERLAVEDADLPDPTTLPPVEGRDVAERANRRWNLDLPQMARVEDLALAGRDGRQITARLFVPENTRPGTIFFIHGGGFAVCSINTHEGTARLLAREAGCAVVSVDYRLAPEHPFPAGLHDCIDAYRDMLRVVVSETGAPVSVCGDSAGANLALSLMLHEQAEKRSLPDCAMLFYGVYGNDFGSPSYMAYADGPGLTRAKMMRYLDWYAPAEARHDPLISPLRASDEALRDLPPIYLNAAEIDPLYSDTVALSERLRSLGKTYRMRVFDGVVHGFMMMTPVLAEARDAIGEAARAFRELTAPEKGIKLEGTQ